jgi:hypothetical protein
MGELPAAARRVEEGLQKIEKGVIASPVSKI